MKSPLIFLCMAVLVYTSCKTHQPLETVKKVDLTRYAGTWYEISTIPIRQQRGCSCTRATYELTEKGYVKVYNYCVKNGKEDDVTGKAFVKDTTNAKLAVQFFWPFRGKYWIIELDDNYQYAVIGTPERDNLWILSRTPQMDEKLYAALLANAAAKGFNTSALVRTVQNCK